MKKMRFISCVILVVSIMIPALDTKALTFNVLPIKQVTKQWSVEVSKAKQIRMYHGLKKGNIILILWKSKTLVMMQQPLKSKCIEMNQIQLQGSHFLAVLMASVKNKLRMHNLLPGA